MGITEPRSGFLLQKTLAQCGPHYYGEELFFSRQLLVFIVGSVVVMLEIRKRRIHASGKKIRAG
jgi:hypothetical protein